MDISVVIPYYNDGNALLDRAVRSVANNTFEGSFEVIVVDDCSETPAEISESINCETTVLRTPSNLYAGGARNFGADKAKGTLLMFLDADDEYLPGRLDSHWKLLQRFPAAIMAAGPTLVSDQEEIHYPYIVPKHYPEFMNKSGLLPATLKSDVMYRCPFTSNMITFPTSVFREMGGFDESLRCWEEWDLAVRATQIGDVAWDFTPYAIYHRRQGSVTTTRNHEKYETGAVMIGRWLRQFPDAANPHQHHLRSERTFNVLVAAQILCEERGAPGKALRLAISSLGSPTIWGFRSVFRYLLCCLRILQPWKTAKATDDISR